MRAIHGKLAMMEGDPRPLVTLELSDSQKTLLGITIENQLEINPDCLVPKRTRSGRTFFTEAQSEDEHPSRFFAIPTGIRISATNADKARVIELDDKFWSILDANAMSDAFVALYNPMNDLNTVWVLDLKKDEVIELPTLAEYDLWLNSQNETAVGNLPVPEWSRDNSGYKLDYKDFTELKPTGSMFPSPFA